jgi:NDP-sugar pyrophosphorylase family protein
MSLQLLPVAILAGGIATRMRPLTETIPKALLEVNGEPFIAHQLKLLRQRQLQRVVLCLGYLGELIVERIGDGSQFGLQVEYSFDSPVLLGTGGCLKNALPLLGEQFFVLYGDSYLECDYVAVQNAFIKSAKQGLMTVFLNEGRWDGSNIEYKDGRIINYVKRNITLQMKHIDYGLGILSRSAFDETPNQQAFDLETVYQKLLSRQELAGYEVTNRFYEIGSPSGLAELRQHLSTLAGREISS